MGLLAIPILGKVVEFLGSMGSSYFERKKVEAAGKIRIAEAKVEGKIAVEKKRADGDINYNVEAQKGMQASWKDEAFVLVWLSVFIGCFLPWTQPYVKDGFLFLKDNTPEWYVWALLGMVTASFGLKGWKFWNTTKNYQTGIEGEDDDTEDT